MIDAEWWRGRRVFLTGHTGFKGAWLTLWLSELGAEVSGFALPPDTDPSLFRALGLSEDCVHVEGDVVDLPAVQRAMDACRPQVVFHLAAQPLVRRGYREPLRTFDVNVRGTAHVLECCRSQPELEAVVVVTTDKVYANPETGQAFAESAPLGGRDPYSASKAAAEMVSYAYQASFFDGRRVATARSGNVIGGGDWAEDRLVPDAARAFAAGRVLALRDPNAVRPWQHVLDPLRGYLVLARELARGRPVAGGWNFGPVAESHVTVGELVGGFAAAWGDDARWQVEIEPGAPHEAGLLVLDATRARGELGWEPELDIGRAIAATADWYRAFYAGEDARALCLAQIRELFCAP